MKLTLTSIQRYDKDKVGNPLRTKDGRPYTRVSIKTQEYADRFLSGFGSSWNEYWKVGDVVEVDVEPKGEYLNFKRVDRIAELEKRVSALEEFMKK